MRRVDTGQWLSVMPSTVNDTELSCTKFRDALLMTHSRMPGDLPSHCDGCGQPKFDLHHALICKKGGLITVCHNKICNEVQDSPSKAQTPSKVRDEPLIHPFSTVDNQNQDDNSPSSNDVKCLTFHNNDGECGDVLACGFWTKQTHCIIDVRVMNSDAESHRHSTPKKVLSNQEKEKKSKEEEVP